jgi:hypothetical protein
MSRRSSWRIPIRMDVKCFWGDKEYSGTVTNLSENGMFINTEGIWRKILTCRLNLAGQSK